MSRFLFASVQIDVKQDEQEQEGRQCYGHSEPHGVGQGGSVLAGEVIAHESSAYASPKLRDQRGTQPRSHVESS